MEGEAGNALHERRKAIVDEIVDSERQYVAYLSVLEESVLLPLQDAGSPCHDTLAPHLQETIFSNIALIRGVNQRFLGILEERHRQWDSATTQLGDVFVDFAHFFKMYTGYVKNHERALDALRREKKRKTRFYAFAQQAIRQTQKRGTPVESFLIMPVQRIPRYKLLLEQLLEKTPSTHPDFKPLAQALSLIAMTADGINEAIKHRENVEQMLHIQSTFSQPITLVSPTRRFLLQEELIKKCRKADKLYTFFLFNDLLIYGTWKRIGFQPHQIIDINHVFSVESLDDTISKSNKVEYRFQITSSRKSFIVYSFDQETKTQWVEMLQDCKALFKQREATLRRSSIEHISAAPLWTPNEASPVCELCSSHFTALFRRHHCRQCGALVCRACSRHRALIPGQHGTRQRICDTCRQSMTTFSEGSSHASVSESAPPLSRRHSLSQWLYRKCSIGSRNTRESDITAFSLSTEDTRAGELMLKAANTDRDAELPCGTIDDPAHYIKGEDVSFPIGTGSDASLAGSSLRISSVGSFRLGAGDSSDQIPV